MPDLYASIVEQRPDVVERLAQAMELRAADPQLRAFADVWIGDLELAAGARIVEIGCGTGAIARLLAERADAGEVIGIDPSPGLLERARALGGGRRNLSFKEADGRSLPEPEASADAVVLHTVLSHVPEPERVLAEAFRVLRPGGRLAVFDGDYATISLGGSAADPLHACADAFRTTYIHDAWLGRRLPALVRQAGFRTTALRSHGYGPSPVPDYLLSLVDRGADAMAAAGSISADLAAALKSEARRRLEAGIFAAHITYVSVAARKQPCSPRL